MNDIGITWDNLFLNADLEFQDGDLKRDAGLTTAYLMSIYTDRRASIEDNPDDINNLRGWWGDNTTDGDEIGSKLWLLDRASTIEENVNLAKAYLEDALQWAVDDEVVSENIITTERQGRNLIYTVQAKKDSDILVSIKFLDLWEAQFELT